MTPDTVLRWHRRLIARKYDGTDRRGKRGAACIGRLLAERRQYQKVGVGGQQLEAVAMRAIETRRFVLRPTANGITALQMDIKIEGITREIMEIALDQAKEGRMHILGEMGKVISEPRKEMSEHAPRITSFMINPEKIRDVIGKGGATIRSITEETGTSVDLTDDGLVRIASVDKAAADAARKRIEQLTADVEVGKIYEGKVARIMDFGAFVTILPGKDGLVRIARRGKPYPAQITGPQVRRGQVGLVLQIHQRQL